MYRNVKCVAAHKTFQKPQKVIKMNKNIKNIENKAEKVINDLTAENKKLTEEKELLKKQIGIVLRSNDRLRQENQALYSELDNEKDHSQSLYDEVYDLNVQLETIKAMGMFEFGATYGTDEQNSKTGRLFAKALTGGI